MKPIWQSIEDRYGDKIRMYDNDEDKISTKDINTYPTIIMHKRDGTKIQYHGGADYDKLLTWLASAGIINGTP
jgi:hypothetical protein